MEWTGEVTRRDGELIIVEWKDRNAGKDSRVDRIDRSDWQREW